VASAHGGELELSSTLGKGTRACLWLRCIHGNENAVTTGEAHG
jgi:signal transduction histidine kinase